MSKTAWYWNRLKAMSLAEVAWRLQQKHLQRKELRLFRGKNPVVAPLYPNTPAIVEKAFLKLQLPTAFEHFNHVLEEIYNIDSTPVMEISMLGPYRYKDYAKRWHAGFNTNNSWPLEQSYNLKYKQRDDIGDARLNWELNRHRQFQRLALAAFMASSPKHPKGKCAHNAFDGLCPLRKLEEYLDDWVESNPYLWGISWTSPMEIALRSLSWMTAARLLSGASPCSEQSRQISINLRRRLLTGVANMTEYVIRHASGFSSANNHLIIEMTAVAIAGLLFDEEHWREHSLKILDRELFRQTTPDGVDKESSLHYHAFVFEAYLMVANEMHALGRKVPQSWKERLAKMASFIKASMVDNHTTCIFGDDDEARIIDLAPSNYYSYLLGFHHAVFPQLYKKKNEEKAYTYFYSPEKADSLLPQSTPQLPGPDPTNKSVTFPEGGYSFLRRGKMFVGIDHAPLGFGAIAAHGHCDALSFQLFLSGQPIFIDSGTYLYHVDGQRRDMMRSSLMHNTVTINGVDQSEMLGPFLFGKKARTELLSYGDNHVEAAVRGMSGVTHTRIFDLEEDQLNITDRFDCRCSWTATFLLAPGLTAAIDGQTVGIFHNQDKVLTLTSSDGEITSETVEVAVTYGRLADTTAIRIIGNSRKNFVTLHP